MPKPRQPILEFCIDYKRWRDIPRLRSKLEKAAEITLAHLPPSKQIRCTATILLTSDAAVKRLNWDFRGQKKVTNVLSFPQYPASQLVKKGSPKQPLHVGDMALAYQYVVAEAKKDHKLLTNHVIHLTIHSLLHLFGYDHLIETQALRMERLEKKIMAELGLPDPYVIVPPTKKQKR